MIPDQIRLLFAKLKHKTLHQDGRAEEDKKGTPPPTFQNILKSEFRIRNQILFFLFIPMDF